MCEKLAERKKREMESMSRRRKGTVSDSELFARANKLIKVVNK